MSKQVAGTLRSAVSRVTGAVSDRLPASPEPGDPGSCYCRGEQPALAFHHPDACTDDALRAAGIWDTDGFDWSDVVTYPDGDADE